MKKFIIYVIAITVAFSFIRFESSAANKSNAADGYYQLYIDLTSEDNLFLSTYDMNVYLDDKQIGTVPNGKVFTSMNDVLEGNHTIRVSNIGNDDITASKQITVSEDMSFSADIAHGKTIEFKNINISKGTQLSELAVDDVEGLVLSDAEQKLAETGFVNIDYKTVDGNTVWAASNWTVVAQNIAAGTKCDKTVEIVLTCQKTEVLIEEAKQVNAIEGAIDSIGQVTENSASAIQEARRLYDGASDRIKSQVSNYKTLEEAEVKLSQLLDEKAIEAVEKAIQGIGNVTADSGDTIQKARNLYDGLEKRLQIRVHSLSILEEAEKAYSKALDDKAIKEVEEAIESIGEVTEKSSIEITKARSKYDSVEDRIKDQVKNYDVLVKAETKLSQIHIENMNNMLDKMDFETLNEENPDQLKEAYKLYLELSEKEKASINKRDALESSIRALEEKESAERVKRVEEAIDKLSEKEITADDKDSISDVEKEYKKLSDEEKQKVSNSGEINTLKKKLEEALKPKMPIIRGITLDTIKKAAADYGISKLQDDENFGHGTRNYTIENDGENWTSWIEIVYVPDTKEVLAVEVATTAMASSETQQKIIKGMAKSICPPEDAEKVSSWVKTNIGKEARTNINGITYELSVGPKNNPILTAGMSEWEDWDISMNK